MKCAAIPGLEVRLSVSGKDLEEYADEGHVEGAGNEETAVRYVEAVAGAHFMVDLHVHNDFPYKYDDLSLGVSLDGKLLSRFVFRAHPQWQHVKRSVRGLEKRTEFGWQMEKLTFADLSTNDGDARSDLMETLKKIGEITVDLLRIRGLGQNRLATRGAFTPTVSDAGIPEKALKGRALSKRATLSNPVPCAPATVVEVEYPYGRKPFVVFVFKYRSRKDLQIESVIPRSPSPVPLEDRDPDTLKPEEARELIRIQRQKLLDQAKVKQEKREREEDDGDEDGEVEVIEERCKRQRVSTDSDIEVIDLLDGDDEDDD